MNITSEWIKLDWYECEQAIYIGARRQVEAMRLGFGNKTKHGEKSAIEDHMQGAGAEKAVGKRLNLDTHFAINTFANGIADVGEKIEVRWRREQWDLIVREKDHDERAYVLVRGEMPEYEIVGWIWGRDAKKPEFWKNPGGHGYAFFVPEKFLRPISELKVHKVAVGDDQHVAAGSV